MKNIERLMQLLDENVYKQYGSMSLSDNIKLYWSLGDKDSGFNLVDFSNNTLFGASTDGTETKIFPLGLMKRSENGDFTRWIKTWRQNGLNHHQEKLEGIFEKIELKDE